ncbi:MAG: phosphohistidine phosphatase SixA [Thermodesulfobacterium geofontis]|uniref:Phosphohistidine phosphatase SixA n=1 Tax=Thermodesulfobacterium geofontis TaxID=1295609 RepID=A0A2N7QGJ7_9BACT|nr:MAG: phosphohistidine phosphatase SixA [Thermodesulfobacterium geofontis]
MKLYLVQHGIPKPESEDPRKPLSEIGKTEVEKVSQALKKAGIKISKIFHSGKLRAKQTAEIIGDYLNPSEGIGEAEGLNPLDPPEIWAKKLSDFKDPLMLVGHLPHLQKLCSLLVIGDSEKPIVRFRQSGVIALERDEKGNWIISWTLYPDFI